jgi:hypothetical protein
MAEAQGRAGLATVQDDSLHAHDHGHHDGHAHGHHHHHHDHAPPRARSVAAPRARRSMFLASALERLGIAVVLVALIWAGIFWAIG